jgi:hypothetical protein
MNLTKGETPTLQVGYGCIAAAQGSSVVMLQYLNINTPAAHLHKLAAGTAH